MLGECRAGEGVDPCGSVQPGAVKGYFLESFYRFRHCPLFFYIYGL